MRRTSRIGLLLGAGALSMLCTAAPARAADIVYLELTCATQGSIRGNSVAPGREHKIEAYELHHLIREEPGNPRLIHEPLIFTKRVDRSSVNLYTAMSNTESCTAHFRFYRPDPGGSGMVEQYRRITLANARIVAIEPITADVFDPASAQLPDRERIRMVYGSITIEYTSDETESTTLNAN